MKRKLLGVYLKLLRQIWRRLPNSLRMLPAGHAYAGYVDRAVRRHSHRQQYFATFFLRNRAELEMLRRLVDAQPYGARLEMTILACSKGAEVYSMAWIIRSARPDLDLRIHAIDISPEILTFAKRGIYSLEKPDDLYPSTENAVRQKKSVALIPSSDRHAWIFERLSAEELDSMFEMSVGEASVKAWIRAGIDWRTGDANDPTLLERLGPQDIVVANRFLCHMAPPAAERCLRNIGHLVSPGGHLFVYGLDLDVRTKVAREQAWIPVTKMIREIHEGDESLRNAWPVNYWGLEPLDDRLPDWQLRYASVFQIGQKPDEMKKNTPLSQGADSRGHLCNQSN